MTNYSYPVFINKNHIQIIISHMQVLIQLKLYKTDLFLN